MTREEIIENMYLGLFETSTYDWMLEHDNQWKMNNQQQIVVVGNQEEIPDWVLRDFQMWNEDIEKISRM